MKGIINKLKVAENKLGKLSKKVIFHGLQLANGILLVGFLLYFINTKIFNFDFNIAHLTFSMVEAATVIFAEAIIGGLMLDYLLKKI